MKGFEVVCIEGNAVFVGVPDGSFSSCDQSHDTGRNGYAAPVATIAHLTVYHDGNFLSREGLPALLLGEYSWLRPQRLGTGPDYGGIVQ